MKRARLDLRARARSIEATGGRPVSTRAVDASDAAMLDDLQKEAFGYFLHAPHPVTGLIADRTAPGSPSSIAAVGLARSAFPVGVERKLGREEAVRRTTASARERRPARRGSARHDAPDRLHRRCLLLHGTAGLDQ